MFKVLFLLLPIFLFCNEIKQRHILLLNSYNQSMNWVKDITMAVNDVLEPEQNNLIIHIENMDTKRIYTKKHLDFLKETYKNKYKNIKFDLILMSDNNALDFLKENRNEIFGNVPVVFSGINFFKKSDLDGYTNYTGVTEEFDAYGTLQTALKLKPNTKEIFIINDYLKSGIAWKNSIKEQLFSLDKNIKIKYSKNGTIEQLKKELDSLSEDSIVLLGVYFKDKKGKYFTFEKIGEVLSKYSKSPVFCLLEFNLKNGVVGGNVISGYNQGRQMALIAKKVLSGTPASLIPVNTKAYTKAIYDYSELKKYNFDISKLPTDSLILNKKEEKLTFSHKEKRYLKEKKQIKMCIDPNWLPYEGFDKRGRHVGLSSDYFKHFKKDIGIEIEVIKTESWSESLDFVKKRQCDILSMAMQIEERKEYLNFTSPYFSTPLVLATKLNVSFIDSWNQLSGERVGIVRDYAYYNILKKRYPFIKIITVNSTKEGLNLVAEGKLFGFIGSIADISYISQKDFIGELKITAKFDEQWKLSVAVRNDEPILLDIFEKVVQNLSLDTKQKILNKYVSIKYEKGFDYRLFWQVLFILILLVFAILYRYFLLNKTKNKLTILVDKKTRKLKKLNKTLEINVEKRTNDLNLQTQKVKDLLNNAGQGFLSFDINFLIDDEYSLECENLLGKDLKGNDITTLLFGENIREINFFKETMKDALNEKNELTSYLLLSLLPKELIINRRVIQVNYKVLSNNKFMLILTNITDKKKLEKKLYKEQNIFKMITVIISDNRQFYQTVENFNSFAKNIKSYINLNVSIDSNIHTIYTMIHTFKGLFSQLYMNDSVNELHKIESKLEEFLKLEKNENHNLLMFFKSLNIETCINKDLGMITQTLGEEFLKDSKSIKIMENDLLVLESKIYELCNLLENKDNSICSDILFVLKKIRNKTLYSYLSSYPRFCMEICKSLKKDLYLFEIEGEKDFVMPDIFIPFINSLIHIFTNCCKHGIENRDERIDLNKDKKGKISCFFQNRGNNLYLEISDDGKGISINSLKKRLVELGLVSKEKISLLSENEIIDFIFDSYFSVENKVDKISGRGVGLSAVKSEVEKLKGKITVKTKINHGTTFCFLIPLGNEKIK